MSPYAVFGIYLLAIIMAIWACMKIFIMLINGRENTEATLNNQGHMQKEMTANIGFYNLVLVAGLIWSLNTHDIEWQFKIALFFLGFIALSSLFSAITLNKKLFLIQMALALISIIFVMI